MDRDWGLASLYWLYQAAIKPCVLNFEGWTLDTTISDSSPYPCGQCHYPGAAGLLSPPTVTPHASSRRARRNGKCSLPAPRRRLTQRLRAG